MKPFIPIDDSDQTGIEDYPNWLGTSWDNELRTIESIRSLSEIDWLSLGEVIDAIAPERDSRGFGIVKINLDGKEIRVCAYDDPAILLDQIPSIDVRQDDGPPDAGPAAGRGYHFFVNEGYDQKVAESDINALASLLGNIQRRA
jgi:hypothetical protein